METLHRSRATLALFVLVFLVPTRGEATPPQAPIQVSLTAPTRPQVGVPLALTFSVTPLIDAPQMKIIFTIPEEVRVVDGATERSLSMSQRETREFVVMVILPHQGRYEFLAGASIQVDADTQFAVNAHVVIDLGPAKFSPRQAPKPQKKFTTKKGEAVME